jgi:DNA-binding GntR family transcriptional regulator
VERLYKQLDMVSTPWIHFEEMGKKFNKSIREEGSAREKAYQHIQEKILTGEWPGGAPVSELALAKEMGLSRTPIREAVRQLAGEGFLEDLANGGMAVAQLRRADIAELYELREAIEVYAVGKAASIGLRSSDIVRLEGFLGECEDLRELLEQRGQSCLDPMQMQRFIHADLGFHTLLLHTAANRRMLKLVTETRLLIRIFSIQREGHSAGQLRQIHEQHRAVLRAVMDARGDDAKAILSAHIRMNGEERMEAYDEWEREHSLQRAAPQFNMARLSVGALD